MHAKRTRDRKKNFVDLSEKLIMDMDTEAKSLMEYLVSIKLITAEELNNSKEKAIAARNELTILKVNKSFFLLINYFFLNIC